MNNNYIETIEEIRKQKIKADQDLENVFYIGFIWFIGKIKSFQIKSKSLQMLLRSKTVKLRG